MSINNVSFSEPNITHHRSVYFKRKTRSLSLKKNDPEVTGLQEITGISTNLKALEEAAASTDALLHEIAPTLLNQTPAPPVKQKVELPKLDFPKTRNRTKSIFEKKSPTELLEEMRESPILRQIKLTRADNISEFRNIYECLKKAFTEPNKKNALTEAVLKTTVVKTSSPRQDININQAVVNFIYHKILRGISTQIYYFFDDRGYSLTLHEIDKLASIIYGENILPIQTDVKEELKIYYTGKPMILFENDIETECEYAEFIRELPFPKISENEKIQEQKKKCMTIFQRLYPLSGDDLIMPPITFLGTHQEFMTSEEVFEQALKMLLLPDMFMPYSQKLRTVNFVRTYFSSQLFLNEPMTKNMKTTIKKMVIIGTKSEKQELVDLCDEIRFLLEKADSNLSKKIELPSKVTFKVDKFFSEEPLKNPHFVKFIDCLTNDIKFLAAQNFLTITPHQLFNEKSRNEAENFYNQVVSFVVKQFMKTFEGDLDQIVDAKMIKYKLNAFFEIFIDIAHKLKEKQDYLSSCAIFNVFYIPEFYHLLERQSDKQNKNTFSKTKKTMLKSVETERKLHELETLFTTEKNFEELRKQMKICQTMDLFFVPLLAPIKSMMMRKLENINLSYQSKTDPKRLQLIGDEVWETNQFLNNIRAHFNEQSSAMQTDIGYYLCQDAPYSEEKLDELYKKLKLVLG